MVAAPVDAGYYVILTRTKDEALRTQLDKRPSKEGLAVLRHELERIYRKYNLWDSSQAGTARLLHYLRPWPPVLNGRGAIESKSPRDSEPKGCIDLGGIAETRCWKPKPRG